MSELSNARENHCIGSRASNLTAPKQMARHFVCVLTVEQVEHLLSIFPFIYCPKFKKSVAFKISDRTSDCQNASQIILLECTSMFQSKMKSSSPCNFYNHVYCKLSSEAITFGFRQGNKHLIR